MRIFDQSRRGTATVELALLLPFLAFLFVMAVDFGRVFSCAVAVENCACNGARFASDPVAAAQSPYASIEQAALADAADLNPAPSVASASGVDEAGNPYVEVTVTWQFQTATNYPGMPTAVVLARTVRMRVAPAAPN